MRLVADGFPHRHATRDGPGSTPGKCGSGVWRFRLPRGRGGSCEMSKGRYGLEA
ncbi:hypothetical protein BDY17DRAFT_305269 [Neohortaea acidophila]|uniref:Uncharacterized protein n=1 Tax=Neohortaea acidophila TaxID=245834 RepID=A0A6A6PH02_9PEZI|nr:uncharacterized protein BDY17DRAFT_305269 [Neohortaea acidophila]KAF2479269.1 hypothetical protein BDY17DRAFT_305269 [Neohortaea acidophila]